LPARCTELVEGFVQSLPERQGRDGAIVESGAAIAATVAGYSRQASLASSPTARHIAGKFRSTALATFFPPETSTKSSTPQPAAGAQISPPPADAGQLRSSIRFHSAVLKKKWYRFGVLKLNFGCN